MQRQTKTKIHPPPKTPNSPPPTPYHLTTRHRISAPGPQHAHQTSGHTWRASIVVLLAFSGWGQATTPSAYRVRIPSLPQLPIPPMTRHSRTTILRSVLSLVPLSPREIAPNQAKLSTIPPSKAKPTKAMPKAQLRQTNRNYAMPSSQLSHADLKQPSTSRPVEPAPAPAQPAAHFFFPLPFPFLPPPFFLAPPAGTAFTRSIANESRASLRASSLRSSPLSSDTWPAPLFVFFPSL